MRNKNYRIFLTNKTSIFRTLFVAWKNQVMKITAMLKTGAIGMLCWMSVALSASIARADSALAGNSAGNSAGTLAGTWSLVAADVIHVDGTRTRDYGAAPSGSLLIDQQGHYSLQIFKAERPRFASGDKLTGTQAEYEAAVLGSSTHFGTVSVDQAAGTLTFKIENASFPNWEGAEQKRKFELNGDELSYRVPPRPDGNTPISVWRRLK
jgi:Lipocalin-like domain